MIDVAASAGTIVEAEYVRRDEIIRVRGKSNGAQSQFNPRNPRGPRRWLFSLVTDDGNVHAFDLEALRSIAVVESICDECAGSGEAEIVTDGERFEIACIRCNGAGTVPVDVGDSEPF
jgi:hypothetical protein